MYLKRIELTNFRQHKRLDVDFRGNLIAVFGPNDSGKSNLIEAIQFALAGGRPGFTKADLTTWGEKDGWVKLIFTAGCRNEEFVVVRKTDGNVTLKVGGKTITRLGSVEQVLHERAGFDKELVSQIIFVPQKGIDAILFDDPKNRELAFQRLIGLGDASRIYGALCKEISARSIPQGFDEMIVHLHQQLVEQEEQAKACREALKRYEAGERYTEELRLKSIEAAIEKTKNVISGLVRKKALVDKVRAKIETLKRVRDWFHYREGPRIMSQNVKRELTACVNSYLAQFCAPFIVEAPKDGFGFCCRFLDGRMMTNPLPDASLLSCGHKVALSIAFRMALYMHFGGELGLLCLDDPTAYLDEAGVGHFGKLLGKIGTMARNKGLQILMATHEKALMHCANTKINLTSTKV